ncbi:hypothetical protein ABT160_05145 [Streptomyces sp. NPDC001941]|uniref:hypothetical protein n=1 Tax=Streptomyces sp. NPDC001941 TaxID=3154659 RepID=UPI003333283B
MSLHYIEDLVADSIRALDARHGPGAPREPRVRDWIAALYAFQDGHDCSFTRFRVMDALLCHGYAHRFPVRDHPDHADRRAYFDALTDFTPLRAYADDAEEADDFTGFDDWLADGYVQPPHLYCESGTPLWRRMVSSGRLTGAAAEEPRPVPLVDAVSAVAEAAEAAGDLRLIADWYALGCRLLLGGPGGCPYAPDELAEIPAVASLHTRVRRTGALSEGVPEEWAPPVEFIEDDELESWWWEGLMPFKVR